MRIFDRSLIVDKGGLLAKDFFALNDFFYKLPDEHPYQQDRIGLTKAFNFV